MEHFARGQIGGAFQQGSERLEHFGFARGQIGGVILPRGRMIGAPCRGADRWGHFNRGQKYWSTLVFARGQIGGGI